MFNRLFLFVCLFFFVSCEVEIDNVNHNTITLKTDKTNDYTVISSSKEEYFFLFDKNLEYGDNTSVLLNATGNVIVDFKNDLNMVVSGKFYKESSILLSLDTKKLLLYDIKSAKSYEVVIDNLRKNFLDYNEFYLVNDSVAICTTDRSFGGDNYLGNNLLIVDLKQHEIRSIEEDIISIYQIEEELFYTKSFQFSYKIDSDKGVKQWVDIGKKALNLTSNRFYSTYITWGGLSKKLQELLGKENEDYSDRLYNLSLLNKSRYENNYSFEVMNNKSKEIIFKDVFPKEGYDIQTVNFINDSNIAITLFKRSSPATTRVFLYSIKDNGYEMLPEGRKLIHSTKNHVVLSSHKGSLGIYSLIDKKMKEVKIVGEMVEQFMSKGSSDNFFYATKNIGMGCDLYKLDIPMGTIHKVKELTNEELGYIN